MSGRGIVVVTGAAGRQGRAVTRALLAVTVLSPMAFMELMTDRAFFPSAGVWHVWPKLDGLGL